MIGWAPRGKPYLIKFFNNGIIFNKVTLSVISIQSSYKGKWQSFLLKKANLTCLKRGLQILTWLGETDTSQTLPWKQMLNSCVRDFYRNLNSGYGDNISITFHVFGNKKIILFQKINIPKKFRNCQQLDKQDHLIDGLAPHLFINHIWLIYLL